mmetsp:Transcript_31888/g.78224  ORF Transcript_31888/g.78224 Transcript_31888/m.78224 type:complete len:309 (-) Transcript_31888:438-1364(-)
MVVSLRLLRACMDGKVSVMDFARLHFEVVHVGKDEAHGDMLHVLMTCSLGASAVAPLTFTAFDRLSYQIAANTVTGTFCTDSTKVVKGETGMEVVGDALSSSALELAQKLVKFAYFTWGWNEMVELFRTGILSILRHFIRTHIAFGIAPDGVPWTQWCTSVVAIGISTGFRPIFWARKSKDLNMCSVWSFEPKPFLFGVLKTPPVLDGGPGKMSCACLGFDPADMQDSGKPTILMNCLVEINFDPVNGVKGHTSNLFWNPGARGSMPNWAEFRGKRVGPPNPGVMAEFCMFDKAKVLAPGVLSPTPPT